MQYCEPVPSQPLFNCGWKGIGTWSGTKKQSGCDYHGLIIPTG